MFRLSDHQGKLFDAYGLMTPHKKAACEKSWAGPFREKALPILLRAEPEFAELYDERMGRPNCPVALLAGLHILKEMNDLTDMEALGELEFDARWWYAFMLEPDEAKLCQKTASQFPRGRYAAREGVCYIQRNNRRAYFRAWYRCNKAAA